MSERKEEPHNPSNPMREHNGSTSLHLISSPLSTGSNDSKSRGSIDIPFSEMNGNGPNDDDHKEDPMPQFAPTLNLVSSWTVNDVLLWFKKLENGMFMEYYPDIADRLMARQIDGFKLKTLDDLTLQKLGVKNPTHRALILDRKDYL